MADIEHVDIADPEIHEPKGVAAAASGRVYVANGTGSGAWSKIQDGSVDSEAAVVGAVLEADGGGNAAFTKRMFRYEVSVGTPGAVGANTTTEHSVTVTGVLLASDEVVCVIKPTHQAGLTIGNTRVTADNTVAVQFVNCTGGGITPTASETYTFFVWRR